MTADASKSRAQLIDELAALRARVEALERAETERQRARHAERQRSTELETLWQASLNLTASLDLDVILHLILDYALQLVKADDAHIFTYDGEHLTFGAALWADAQREIPLNPPRPEGLTYRVAQSGEPVVVPNMSDHPLFRNQPRPGAIIGLPLRVCERVCGVMNVAYLAPHAFEPGELRVLALLADQAAIAVQNAQHLAQIETEIQERQRVEAALRENEARYRSLFEDSPISLWEEDWSAIRHFIDARRAEGITDFDAYFQQHPEAIGHCIGAVRILDVNRATLALYEIEDKAALYEKRGLELVLTPEASAVFREEVIALAGGATSFESKLIEQTRQGKKLHTFVSLAVAPGYEASWAKVFVSVIDITERKRAELALQEQQSLLRRVLDLTPHPIFVRDRAGHFTLANQALADFYDTTTADLIGKTDADFTPNPEEAERFLQDDREIMESLQERTFEDAGTDAAGNLRWFQMHMLPLVDADGVARHVLGIAMDITGRKQAETQALVLAREQERAKTMSDFVQAVAHDLKTPLTTINTNLYILQKSPEPGKQALQLEVLRAQVIRLGNLVDDILTMARLDRGEPFSFAVVDLAQVARDINIRVKTMIAGKPLSLELDIEPGPLPVWADEKELHRALLQIVENAIQFTPSEGCITIQARRQDDQAAFLVRDTGQGINPATLPYIFEHFYRADPARSSSTGGTGLGLAIAKKIIDAHGGTIEVESAPGQGSTFCVRLPRFRTAP